MNDQDTPPGASSPGRPRLWTAILFWVLVVLATGLLVASVAIPLLTSHGYTDSSPTMEPAISPGDRLVVAGGSDVRPGDIVVLHHPAAATSPDDTYVLRVIGVPGDHVACCNAHGRVTVNGKPLNETYVYPGNPPSRRTFSDTLRRGQIWVMGDHRDISGDSRLWGPVSESGVAGRVILIIHGSSFTAVRTPRTFVAQGLAPPDTRLQVYVRLALVAAGSIVALVILVIVGIASWLVRWRRSRRAAAAPPGPGLPDTVLPDTVLPDTGRPPDGPAVPEAAQLVAPPAAPDMPDGTAGLPDQG